MLPCHCQCFWYCSSMSITHEIVVDVITKPCCHQALLICQIPPLSLVIFSFKPQHFHCHSQHFWYIYRRQLFDNVSDTYLDVANDSLIIATPPLPLPMFLYNCNTFIAVVNIFCSTSDTFRAVVDIFRIIVSPLGPLSICS